MKSKEVISLRQLFFIIVGYTTGAAFILIAGLNYMKKGIYVSDFFALCLGVIMMIMMSYIIKKYPNKDISYIAEDMFGKVGVWFAIMIFLLAAFFIGCLTEYHISNLMSQMIMLEMPKWVVVIFITIASTLILNNGFEVTSRAIECIYPLLLGVTFILFVTIFILMFDYKSLWPIANEKPVDIIRATIVSYAFPYADMLLLLFIFPLLKQTKGVLKVSLKGTLTVGLFFILQGIVVVSAFGGTQAQKFNFPFFEVARLISFGEYFERLEILILIIWFFGIFIKLSVCIFVCSKCFQYLFKLKDYKPLVFPCGLLLIPFGVNLTTDLNDGRVLHYIFILTAKLPMIIIFILMFIITLIKSKSIKNKDTK